MARPKKDSLIREAGAQQGLSKEDTRMTFIVPVDTAEKLRAFAYTKNITLKEALTLMIETYIADYQADSENEPLLMRRREEKSE